MNLSRRKFFVGLGIAAAAPAIVRAASIMPVRASSEADWFAAIHKYIADDIVFLEQMNQAQVHMLMYGTAGFQISLDADNGVRAYAVEPASMPAWT